MALWPREADQRGTFETVLFPLLLPVLKVRLLGQVANLHSYWQNLYHHQDLGTVFDDSLMALAASIGRRSLKSLSNSSASCDEFLSSLHQVNSFHYNDYYKYSLFLLASGVEVAVKPINKLFVKPSPLVKHLEALLVSSEFDQKEQLSRNFLRNLSPFSDPVLVYKFKPLKGTRMYNLTCLWVDPIGVLRDVSLFSLDANSLIGHVKAGMKQPHLPGKSPNSMHIQISSVIFRVYN